MSYQDVFGDAPPTAASNNNQTNPVQQPVQQQQSTVDPDKFAQVFPDLAPKSFLQQTGDAFSDGLTIFNDSMGRLNNGIVQAVVNGLNYTGVNTGNASNNLANANTAMTNADQQAIARSPIASKYAGYAGGIGQGIEGYAFGGAPSGILGAAAVGAGINEAQYNPNGFAANIPNAIEGGIAGAGLWGLGKGAGMMADYLAPQADKLANLLQETFAPKASASTDMTANLTPQQLQNGIAAQQNAKQYGIQLNPAQATGNQLLNTMQKQVPMTKENQRALQIIEQNNQDTGTNMINNMVGGFLKDGDVDTVTSARDALYKQLEGKNLSDETMQSLVNDPQSGELIQSAIDQANNTKASTVKNLPDNSITKLNVVQQNLGAQIHNGLQDVDPNTGESTLKPDQHIAMQQAQDKLINAMDNAAPDIYPQARNLAAQIINNRQYQSALDSINTTKGNTEPAFLQQYNKLFGNNQKQAQFAIDMQKAGQTPEQIAEAQNQIQVLGQAKDSQLGARLNAAPETSKLEVRIDKPIETLKNWSQALYKSNLYKNVSNPDTWQQSVDKVINPENNQTNKQQLSSVIQDPLSQASLLPVANAAVNGAYSVFNNNINQNQ